MIKDIRGGVKWEPFSTNRRYEPLSPFTFLYDGHYGKRPTHKEVITAERMKVLRKENKSESFGKVVEVSGPHEVVEELHTLKEQLSQKRAELEKLQRQIEIFQGNWKEYKVT